MDELAACRSAASLSAWELAPAAPSNNYDASNQPRRAHTPRWRAMSLEENLTAQCEMKL